MSFKVTATLAFILSLILFISSFSWFSAWGYGLLAYCGIAILCAIIRVRFENFFEINSSLNQLFSGILLFTIIYGIISLAILAYSVSVDTDSFRMKPD